MLSDQTLCGLLTAVAVGASACRRPEPPAPDPSPALAGRSGVRVPLPDGWSAQLSEDQAFRAGPPGHPVLRIDLRPGQGAALPSSDALASALKGSLRRAQLTLTEQATRSDFALVVYLLTPATRADAGPSSEAPGLVAAKRVGSDLFLCATTPGATEEEVDLAARACEALTLSSPRK